MTPGATLDLILWRHAEADDHHDDLKRELTRHGRQQAERTAAWLARQLAGHKLAVVTSEARRAQQTASALTADFRIDARINPDVSSVNDYLQAAGWPNPASDVTLLVGHQPTIGRLVSVLLHGVEQDLPVKKSSIWWLQRRVRDGNVQYVLKASISPDLLPD
ncbi:SixA phosphatase family protein [Amantichitinum ursilacus]|uniref:Phosphohistidine phosphatase n=1 Tax=Amantichitinum ursilacus TaxID=857265 RepID=A0A0N0XGL9_9NEIS|nr:histidine phosphatase family protein [Amantichitinum ursilacus]KPC50211.1 phosphohistidine phosphatase [Amantichitinum ursilacus]